MKIKYALKNERGSITVLTAIVVSTLLVMMSASQNITTVFAGKTLQKSLAVKVGKRGNGGTLSIAQTLFDTGTVRYVANTDGTINWGPVIATDSYTYNPIGNNGSPTIKMSACNPLFYDVKVATDIFAAKTLPSVMNCVNAGVDLSPVLKVGAISGGGVWSRTGPNYLTVDVKADALLARAAAGPTVPAVDNARIGLHAPKPACTIGFAATEIVVNQTTVVTMHTSRNTDKAYLQQPNGATTPFPGAPAAPALPNYALDQGGSMNVTPTVPGVYRYNGVVVGPVDPDSGQQQSDTCTATLVVYAEPKCLLWADPGLIVSTQNSTLHLQDNADRIQYKAPILKAVLDGNDVTNPIQTTFEATKVVTPGRVGNFRYTATLTTVNNFSKSCAADLIVQPPPFCSIGAPNKTQIIFGDSVVASMTTNYPADTINTAVFEGQNIGVGGGTITTAPPRQGAYKLSGYVYGPNGSSYNCQSATTIQVYPAPFCGVVAYPSAVEVGQPVAFTMTTNNSASPILSASLAGYAVGANGGSVTLSAPGSPGRYTASGAVNGVNGSYHSCTSNEYNVYPRAACSLTASANAVTLGDGVQLNLSTNYASDPTIVDSSTCYNGACHRFGPGGGSLYWATNGSGGEPSFPAGTGTFHFNGYVKGNYGSTGGTCGTDVSVVAPPPPQCPYRNPAYEGVINVPTVGLFRFSRTLNNSTNRSNSCYAYPAPYSGPQVFGIPAGASLGASCSVAGNWCINNSPAQAAIYEGACGRGSFVCYNYAVFNACNNPAADMIIDLNDPACSPLVYHVRNAGGGCFDPDTLITLADNTTKKARDIRAGDQLLSAGTKQGARIKSITRGPENIPMWEVGFKTWTVKVTEGHPFVTPRGMREAAKLTTDDEVLGADGRFHPITVLRKLPVKKGQMVWNFELDNESASDVEHQIIGNGIVTGDLFVQKRLTQKTLPAKTTIAIK